MNPDTESQPLISNDDLGRVESDEFDKEELTGIYDIELLTKLSKEHEEVLKFTTDTFDSTIFVSLFTAFTYTLRVNIFLAYCKTFDDFPGTHWTGITFAASYIVTATVSVLFGYAGVMLIAFIPFVITSIQNIYTQRVNQIYIIVFNSRLIYILYV